MALTPTDLPEPVVPAISRWGMLAPGRRRRARRRWSRPAPWAGSGRLLVLGRGQQVAQIDGLAPGVGQLDADGVAARDHGDAAGARRSSSGRCRRTGPRRGPCFTPGGGDQFVEGDDGAGADLVDLAAHAELGQHALQHAGRSGAARPRRLARRAAWAWPAWPARAGRSRPAGRSRRPSGSRAPRAPDSLGAGLGRGDRELGERRLGRSRRPTGRARGGSSSAARGGRPARGAAPARPGLGLAVGRGPAAGPAVAAAAAAPAGPGQPGAGQRRSRGGAGPTA